MLTIFRPDEHCIEAGEGLEIVTTTTIEKKVDEKEYSPTLVILAGLLIGALLARVFPL